ncbi:hypothetical protein [Nocardioides okcheonensis]|uniref:hypothetical protein n=1 Tax=Nocardioides okcheonensis TaxID=2894081 RepID=UPI001E3022F4|nr:hypothetical protein [Nocardioides okcheonensis]UFN46071.1 hypothetical protein LN652_07685 [Nocardioides okcheonensis]
MTADQPERLTKASDLAAQWDMTESELKRRARRHGWPVVRFSRTDWRFTDQQIKQIVSIMTTQARAPERPSPTGQSKLSRARSR